MKGVAHGRELGRCTSWLAGHPWPAARGAKRCRADSAAPPAATPTAISTAEHQQQLGGQQQHPAAAPVRVHDAASAPRALDAVDTLIFDCDGVLWRGNETIRNAPEALRSFRSLGKRLLFVTNNSSKSRRQYVEKFKGLGLEVAEEEIVSSSYCAAAYLQSVGLPGPGRKVLLLGWRGVELELQQAGIPYIGGEHFPLPHLDNMDDMSSLQVDPDIGAVVVGWDPHFSYSRLVYASICLRELPGCRTALQQTHVHGSGSGGAAGGPGGPGGAPPPVPGQGHLVATNLDCADHIGGGRMMPGTGGLTAAVEIGSGVKAVNVGKGGEWLFPFLCERFQLDPARTAIVGDRMDTDIHMGKVGGLVTVLPLTGVTQLAALQRLPPGELPDVVVASVANLAGME